MKEAHFDVVHAHGPIAAVLARAVAGDVPVVSTSHTPFTSLHPLTRAAWTLGARRDGGFVVVARTDARAVEGLDAAIDRARAEGQRLASDKERLLAERHEQATNLRVEQVARERLGMRVISPALVASGVTP